jgi:dGTPase
MVSSVLEQFKNDYDQIMEGKYDSELIAELPSEVRGLIKACKKVGSKFVYPSQSTLKLELMGRRVIHDLMDVFWEGAQRCGGENSEGCEGFAKKAFSLISKNYQVVFKESFEKYVKTGMLSERYCRLQLVTDQISGMTDSYATMLHKKLMNG